MRHRYFAAILGLLSETLLAGCATPDVPTTVATTGMPSAELALRNSINQVNADMAQIGAMQPATYASVSAAPVMPDELIKPVRFIWSGPLDAGVRKLADSIGYKVAVFGPRNAQPVIVAVDTNGQVVGAFQALGTQAGTAATVEVDPLHHQVDVIHHV